MMIKAFIILFGCLLIRFGLPGKDANRKKQPSILQKFQQHDYVLEFERIELTSYNKHLMKFANITTFKYNRTTPVVNASFVFAADLGYNVELVMQAYAFLSNEYRVFPIRFQMNFCQAVASNALGLADFSRCGTFTECPLVKEKVYSICNWSPNPTMFPPLIPDGRYKLDVQVVFESVEVCHIAGFGRILRPLPV